MKHISFYDAVRIYAAEFHGEDWQGYKCLLCDKVVQHEHNGTRQGMGYMNIAMQSHLKKHYRNNEIPDLSKITREW